MYPIITLKEVIFKGTAASFMITLGVAVLLNQPIIGTFLFALGLLAICEKGFLLFTGKCGFAPWMPNYSSYRIFEILIVNVLMGWLFGYCISIASPELAEIAANKIATWSPNYLTSFIQAFFCGAIMHLAVDLHSSRDEKLGILFGVPIFIFCGFQHCIANSILLGIAATFNPMIFIHILGNWIGGIFIVGLIFKSSGY